MSDNVVDPSDPTSSLPPVSARSKRKRGPAAILAEALYAFDGLKCLVPLVGPKAEALNEARRQWWLANHKFVFANIVDAKDNATITKSHGCLTNSQVVELQKTEAGRETLAIKQNDSFNNFRNVVCTALWHSQLFHNLVDARDPVAMEILGKYVASSTNEKVTIDVNPVSSQTAWFPHSGNISCMRPVHRSPHTSNYHQL